MKVELMKQNKNTPVVRVASAALAVFVLIFSLCFPSFAYTDNSTNGVDFSSQPIPYYDYTQNYTAQQIYNLSLPGFKKDASKTWSYRFSFRSQSSSNITPSDAKVFVFLVYNSSTGKYDPTAFCPDGYDPSISMVYYTTNWYVGSLSSSGSVSIDGTTYYYRHSSTSYDAVDITLPVFNTASDGITAILDWVNNPPASPHSLSTSLPAGNAIIIDVSGNSGEVLSLSSTSALRHKSPWSDGNQTLNYTDTAPSSISTPYGSTISWTGSGNPNLFGGFNTWILNGPLNPSKSYLVIVNPAYPNDNPDSITSNQASNGPIHISCAYCIGYTFVPLSSYWDNGSIANESGSTRLDGEYDESTQSWVTINPSTGEPQNPVSGGMTDVDAEHITINDWLQNISHQIGSFFSGAIGAVSNLVGAGSDFINSLSSLYSWLPGPVYAVLSSALILVITIGVIKVFI